MPLEKDHLRARAAHQLVAAIAQLEIVEGSDAIKVGPVVINGAKDGDAAQTKKRFNANVRSLPVLIHRSGLLQALAFYRAKAKARKLVFFALVSWLRHCRQPGGLPDLASDELAGCERHFEQLIGLSSAQIRVLTSEAQAFLVWLKQLAEAAFDEAAFDEADDTTENETAG